MTIARDLAVLRTPVQVENGGTGNNGTLPILNPATDWNAINTPGEYYIRNPIGTNAPSSTYSWTVRVFNTEEGLKQVAQRRGSTVTVVRSVNNNVWSSWVFSYDTTNIVGTVGQTSGVPNGAIIERGSVGGVGDYIRYADGTQMCWFSYAAGITAYNTAVGSLWYASGPALSFPKAFIASPIVKFGVIAAGADVWTTEGQGFPTATQTQSVMMIAPTSGNRNTIISYIAIGRWY